MARGALWGHVGVVVVEEIDEVLGFGHVFGYEADGVRVDALDGAEEREGLRWSVVFEGNFERDWRLDYEGFSVVKMRHGGFYSGCDSFAGGFGSEGFRGVEPEGFFGLGG